VGNATKKELYQALYKNFHSPLSDWETQIAINIDLPIIKDSKKELKKLKGGIH